MKLVRTSLSGASLTVLVIQLVLVSSIAAKYLYQRSHCPRVWTRASMVDPSLVMRGRYLSMQLTVNGCQSTLPSARQAQFPRNMNGVPTEGNFSVAGAPVVFAARLAVEKDQLVAVRIPDAEEGAAGEKVEAVAGAPCDRMRLNDPVDFYLGENAPSPLPLQLGQELWVEVTVPPKGPPRPTQLAMKTNGIWKTLALQ